MAQPSITTEPVEPGDVTDSSGLTIGKVLVGAIVAASFGVWIYAFSGFAGRTPPDQHANTSYAVLAEPICVVAMEEFDQLPNALEAADNVERAQWIAESNVLLTGLVDDLEELLEHPEVVLNDRDDEITREWIVDWRTYIGNRADYAERLAGDPDAVFYVSAVNGERLERRIPRFANVNQMPACVTPSDVG